jgi:hypothetical protein
MPTRNQPIGNPLTPLVSVRHHVGASQEVGQFGSTNALQWKERAPGAAMGSSDPRCVTNFEVYGQATSCVSPT